MNWQVCSQRPGQASSDWRQNGMLKSASDGPQHPQYMNDAHE